MAFPALIQGQSNRYQENKLKPKDHVLREVVNDLRAIAIKFHDADQLRERLRAALEPLLAACPVVAGERERVQAVVECPPCNGHGATHYQDGEWEGRCAACSGTGVLPAIQAQDEVPEAAQQNGGLIRAALIDLMALEAITSIYLMGDATPRQPDEITFVEQS